MATIQAVQAKGATALVTGASRGLGRGISAGLAGEGAQVIGLARSAGPLERLRTELGDAFTPVTGDAADPVTAGELIDAYRPSILVLNAGASPLGRPLHHHTWETFSRNWEVDVKHAFHWVRESLLAPLAPGSTVITLSSGAALFGSPLSGGYAGAKAAVRFLTRYAADESDRAGLGIRFVSILPKLTPATDLGARAVAAYRARAGEEASAQFTAGPVVTPDLAGQAVLELLANADPDPDGYVLTPGGLVSLSQASPG